MYLRYIVRWTKRENRSPVGTHGNTWRAGDHLQKLSLVGSISSSVPTWPSGEMGHGWDMEIEFNELGFYTWKPSALNLIYVYRNRVRWTWFLYMETEFIELDFLVCPHQFLGKLSPLDSNCSKWNKFETLANL